MKIGISSAVMYPMQSENSIARLRELGFDIFEFFYNCDEEISEEYVDKIREENHDISFVSLHPYTAFAEAVMFFSGYARRTEESIEKYKKVFRTAKKLGVKFFTLHGDRAYNGISDESCILTDESAGVLSLLAGAAKEEGISLCLENVSWCKSANVKYIEAVSKNVPGVFFTLDLKQARRAGVPYEEYISAMGNKIRNVHVSDFDDTSDCILPGEGKFDFKKLQRELSDIGYSGDVLIEVYSKCIRDDVQILNSKQFLENVFLK